MSVWRLFWASLALALAGFAMISLWTMPQIQAGGLQIPDVRLTGYSLADFRHFLAALSDQGRVTYLGPERVADTMFPIGLTGVLAFGIYLGFRRWSRFVAAALALLPLAYLVCDMLENAAIAGLLRVGPEALSADAVARASAFTVWKFRLIGASMLLVVAGGVTHVLLRRRGVA